MEEWRGASVGTDQVLGGGMEASVSPFCWLLGCLEVLKPLGGSVMWWGRKGMGVMTSSGLNGKMLIEPGSSLGAGAASSWSIQLLGHPWELQMCHIPGIWDCCCPCFSFALGPGGSEQKSVGCSGEHGDFMQA